MNHSLISLMFDFLRSRRHLVGCVLALIGPVLLFTHVIAHGWLWITLGLYMSGVLLTPATKSVALPAPQAPVLTLDQALTRLQPKQAVQILNQIYQRIDDMVQPERERSGIDERLFALDDIVQRYIPEMLTQYLQLPQQFRSEHVLKSGQTAQAMLLEQLQLLDGEVHQLSLAIAENDAARLAEFSQFLQQRFAKAPQWDEKGQLKP
jgi:hypothetical protein